METPEILLADRLNQKGRGIDLVLAHHPEGRAYANFYEVMKMQADILIVSECLSTLPKAS